MPVFKTFVERVAEKVAAIGGGGLAAGLLNLFDSDGGLNAAGLVDKADADLSENNTALAGRIQVTGVMSAGQVGVTGTAWEPADIDADSGSSERTRGGLFSVELLGGGTRSGQAQGVFANVDIEGGAQTVAEGVHGEIYAQAPAQVGTAYGVQSKVYGGGTVTTAYGVESAVAVGTTGYNFHISQNDAGTKWGFYNAVAGLRSFTAGSWLFGKMAADDAAPASGQGTVYLRDNGSGKMQLVARFPTGAVQVLATEP